MTNIINCFTFIGNVVSCKEFGSGHINTTMKIVTDTGHAYILQKINHTVFKQPVQVMENAVAVTEHLRKKDSNPRHTLRFLKTKSGDYCLQDPNGNYWRMYEFIPGLALDAPERLEDLYAAGLGFGRFQQMLLDFPVQTLHETIPHFHDTPNRYAQLEQAVQADRLNRVKEVHPQLEWLMEQKPLASSLLENKALPLRVTHNDTKLNNVLLDTETHAPLCVLDLDTVMPGLSAYDFGDAIRFGAAAYGEDAPENHMDFTLFTQYAKGFLEAAPNLTEDEIQALPMGAFLMTLEVGVRFLTDYLDGDQYFRIAYPTQNLDRANNQLMLAKDIKEKLPEMAQIIQTLR